EAAAHPSNGVPKESFELLDRLSIIEQKVLPVQDLAAQPRAGGRVGAEFERLPHVVGLGGGDRALEAHLAVTCGGDPTAEELAIERHYRRAERERLVAGIAAAERRRVEHNVGLRQQVEEVVRREPG